MKLSYILKRSLGFRNSMIYMLIEPVAGYTRFVSFTKVGLIAIAFVLAVLLVFLPILNPVHDEFKITFSGIEKTDNGEKPVMMNPRFQGTDSKHQTFNITAKKATKENTQQLLLDEPAADINYTDGSWVTLMANEGALLLENKTLDLIDNVSFFYSEGYEFHTPSVHLNLEDDSAFGSESVEAVGPLGNLSASSFVIEEKGNRILFQGGVKLVFYQSVMNAQKNNQ